MLQSFGGTLAFVVQNLTDVLNVLDFHLSGDRGTHYEHVEKMIKYETTYKLVGRKVSG